MKQFCTIVLLSFFIISPYQLFAKNNDSCLSIENAVAPPTAVISGDATVCQNAASPVITFTGSGGTAPYTFTYRIGTGPNVTIISTGNTATVNVSTVTAGTFIYTLENVSEGSNTPIVVTGQTATVIVNSLPSVDFTFINSQCSGTAVQFSTSSPGNSYTWNFGDSTTSTQKNPSHTFNSLGCGTTTFNVTLTITDSSGCSNSKTQIITIQQQPDINFEDVNNPFNQFSNCTNTSSNFSYTLTVGNFSASTCITSYAVNWGDGISENNISFPKTHTYSQPGVYNMTFSALGNGCASSKTYIVKNISNPSGGILNPGGTTDMCIPTPIIQYTIGNWATNSPGTTYAIDFGDGSPILNLKQDDMIKTSFYISANPASSANYPVPYSYNSSSCSTTNKEFTIKLIVTNACKSTSGTVVGGNTLSKPNANFTVQNFGCVNTNILFTNTTVSGYGQNCDQNAIYKWNFGDGTPIVTTSLSPPQNINHIYTNSGTYTVTLTVQNFCGTTTKTQQICIESAPVPQFSLNPNSGCAPLAVTTNNTTIETNSCAPPTYLWTVSYTSGYCGTGVVSIPNQTTKNASYNFTVPGTYSIKLTATNSCGSIISAAQTVIVKQPPTVTINPIASLCQTLPNTTINPTASVGNCGTQALTYQWGFPGGIPTFSANAIPGAISYSSAGTYDVFLTVTNECGATAAIKQTFTISSSPTVDVIPNQAKCKGQQSDAIVFTGTLASTIYNWTNNNTAIGLAASGTGNINPFVLNNPGTSVQTATITVTPTINGCSGASKSFTITVNSSPALPGVSPVSYCQNATANILTATFLPNHTLNWYTVATGGTPLAGAPTPSTATVGTVTYYVSQTNSTSGCEGARASILVTVNSLPTVTVNSPVVCSGLSATVIATPGIAGTYSYVWTVPAGFTNPGSVASFSTTVAGTYSVIITNTGTSCVSSSASGTVMANALPNLVITNPAAVCSPLTVDLTSPSITTGSDSGLTFSYWKDNAATIVLSNPNSISTSGTYYIKGLNSNGCTLTKSVVVTVNTTPTITAISNIIKCNNQPSGAINFTSSVVGTTFSWTNDTPSIGLAASGTGNIASFATVNTGTTPVIATVTVTPTANGCTGANLVFTITVNPVPTVNQPLDQEICNGLPTTAISFAGNIPSTIYSWTNDKPTIGLGASGTGDIASFTAINATSSPLIATITVTPSINGCSGTPKTFTITVNPSPAITFSPSPQTICSGGNSASVTLNSTTSGVTFGWTTTQPAGISETIATSGSNTIPVQTLTNTTNADIAIVYNATATVAGGAACLGAIYNYTIMVKPKPSITTPLAQTICSNSAFSITPLDGSGNIVPIGTVYTWTAAAISPAGAITGAIAQNTPQSSIGQTLVNGTDQTATATYMVTPKSGTCSGTPFPAVITVNPSPKVVFSGLNQKICSGSDSSIINLSSPTTGSVTFNWTATIPAGITGATASGSNTIPVQTLINTTANPLTVIYTATATITNGIVCQGQLYNYSITVNPAIVTSSVLSNFNGFNVSAVGASDGAINVTVTGGSGVYTYLWSGPNGFSALTQDISYVPAGAYTLTINDGLCNPVVLPFTLLAPMPMIIQEDLSAHKNVFCNGYLTGEIKVDVTQQSIGPYDYELTLQGGGIVASSINNAAVSYTFTGLKAGVYDIKVTDANRSVKTILGVIITEPAGITASISAQANVLCFGDTNGSATVTAIGGSGVLTYSWNTIPVQTTATATGLIVGTYTVTIADANTCSTTRQVTITEPPILTTTISSQTNVLCFGNNTGAATVSANGGKAPYTFSWNTSPVITTPTATGIVAGTYDVTVTDANNCTKVQQVIITQPSGSLSSAISNSNDVSCFGGSNGSATVSVTNGTLPYTYSWNTTPIQTLATATGLAQGNYIVIVTDFNGCTTSSSIAIAQPPAISTSISVQTNVACSGSNSGSATIVANGGTAPYTYSWDTNPVQTTATGINLAMGTYNVTVKDANNCSTIQQVIITEPNGIVTSIASQMNVDCFGKSTGSATISATGGTVPLTYSWNTVTANTSLTSTGLVAGTYHLTVTDANNCSKVQEVIITEPADILITTDLEKDITCFGNSNGAIQITVTGGTPAYTYSWTKNGVAFSTAEDLSNLSPGIYKVTVSDANNCGPKTTTFTITEPPILAVNLLSKTDVLCFGASTGAINVNVVGGTHSVSGYNFVWTGPNGFTSSNQNLAALFAGTYNLIITDNSGCIKTLSVSLTQTTVISIKATTTPIICYGDNNASITLTITGGISPYTILWSNLGTGTFQNNLSAGDYLASITDANNCVTTITVNIPEAPIFTINPVVKNISCFGANNGSINLNLIGGIAPIKLTWSDGSVAGTTRNNLKPGSYTVTIVDSKPCTITRTFVILEPQLLVLSANLTNAFNCDNANSGSINLLVSGGSTPFTYAWSNGATTEDLANIPAGNYLVTVTDFNGCSKQAQYSINRPPPIVPGVITKTDFNCDTKYVKQTFVAQVSGGVPPYQNHWSSGTVSGANNEIMNTNQNGTVILDVTDAIGCKANYTFNVDVPILGTPSFNSNSYAYSTFGTYSVNDPIQFTNTTTGDYISMAWDFGDGTFSTELNPIHTFIIPKEYVVTQTVTCAFGCVYVQKITFIVGKGYVLVVPNAFTPNNDTLNDTFRPVTKALKNVRLDVYDTWGSLIYTESGDVLRGWDGRIKGINAENGNYYCKVSGETFYGAIVNENHPFVLIK